MADGEEILQGDVKYLIAKIEAIEKAQQKFENQITDFPTDIDKAVTAVKDVYDLQIKHLEDRVKEYKEDAEKALLKAQASQEGALVTALNASKELGTQINSSNNEARNKTEASVSDLFRQIQSFLKTSIDVLDGKVNDQKGRLDRMEERMLVQKEVKVEHRDDRGERRNDVGMWVGIVGAGITVMLFAFFISDRNVPTVPPTIVLEREQTGQTTREIPSLQGQ